MSHTNFISHSNTNLKFDGGLTLFIGHNSAGKSSMIDAITFALYGKHTRGSNKNLVRRGTFSSLVQIQMSIRGKAIIQTLLAICRRLSGYEGELVFATVQS